MAQITILPASDEAMSKLADLLFDKMFAPDGFGIYPIFPSITDEKYDPAWDTVYAYLYEHEYIASLSYEERDIFIFSVYYSNYYDRMVENLK
jgi:hypothetical protein